MSDPTHLALGEDGLLGEKPKEPTDASTSILSPVEAFKQLSLNPENQKIRDKITMTGDKTLQVILNMPIEGVGDIIMQQQLIGELRGLRRYEDEVEMLREGLKELEDRNNATKVD
jgi:hypothetical protein